MRGLFWLLEYVRLGRISIILQVDPVIHKNLSRMTAASQQGFMSIKSRNVFNT